MDYLAIVKERAEGKDLSVLGGSVKFVADDHNCFYRWCKWRNFIR